RLPIHRRVRHEGGQGGRDGQARAPSRVLMSSGGGARSTKVCRYLPTVTSIACDSARPRNLERHRDGRGGDDLVLVSDDFADREPALAQMADASVAGLPPASPERRRRPLVVTLPGRPGVTIAAPPSVVEATGSTKY